MNILDFGQIRITQPLNEQELQEMREHEHYLLTININNKLETIVDMIEEADKDLYNEIKDCFSKAKI